MAFTKITNTELNSRGCTTLPNQPMISAQALKQEFDAPAKEIVAPKFNNLIDELEATTAAASIGVVAPTGRTGNTVQALLNDISADIGEAVADAHTHDNKALLDTYDQTNEDLADAVTKKHSHSNKDLLDTYTQSNSDLADAVSKKHEHSNKTVLDKFGESSGQPTYDGNVIGDTSDKLSGIRGVTSGLDGAVVYQQTKDGINWENKVAYVKGFDDKADKVTSATSGNFAGLDSNGNLTDSGSKASDFLTQHQDITGKADKVSSATNGNFAGLDSNGNLTDSGKKASDFLTSTDLASYYTKTEVDAVTGDLTDLTTTAKNNLVAAINEAAASGGGLSDAFQKVKSGVTTLTASGADTLELKAGSNVTLTPDASDNSITISASGGGQSTGDMLAADYDSSYNVKNAGGIPGYVSTAISGKADSSSLATVATSGSYNDLSNKPTIPDAQIQSDWTQTTTTAKDYIKNKPSLATVATSGSYNDLSNKPTIPAAQVNSDWNASSGVAQILNKPTIPDVSGKADKVSGATSGNFASLNSSGNLADSGYKASDFIDTYLEQTVSTTANADTTVTFTNNAITNDSVIDVFAGRSSGDVSGSQNAFPYKSIYVDGTNHTCTIVFPALDTSISMKVRIYIK